MTKEFTITAFSENHIGLLNRITIIFTRRHINIESLTVSASAIEGLHKFTIVVDTTQDKVEKVIKQIDKLVEVTKAFYHTNDEIIHQEIAFLPDRRFSIFVLKTKFCLFLQMINKLMQFATYRQRIIPGTEETCLGVIYDLFQYAIQAFFCCELLSTYLNIVINQFVYHLEYIISQFIECKTDIPVLRKIKV